jgi:hypothetical protein
VSSSGSLSPPNGNFASFGFVIDEEYVRIYESTHPQINQEGGRRDEDVVEENLRTMNADQRCIFNNVIGYLDTGDESGRFIFIDGPGGSGKTFLYNTIIRKCRMMGKKYFSLAWTGIAASLLIDGMTSHSKLGLPLQIDETTVIKTCRGTKKFEELRQVDIIIWDEFTLVPHRVLPPMLGDGRPHSQVNDGNLSLLTSVLSARCLSSP